jgi:hypothetical protein
MGESKVSSFRPEVGETKTRHEVGKGREKEDRHEVGRRREKEDRHEVGRVKETREQVTLQSDSASIILALEVKLRLLESKGIPYESVNRYLRARLSKVSDSIGLFSLSDILTYDPRTEPKKYYADAYSGIQKIPNGLDISGLSSIVEGLTGE